MDYSIDKVKIRITDVEEKIVQRIMDKLSVNGFVSSQYVSGKIEKCHYNYIIGQGEGAVYFGVSPNWLKEEYHNKIVVLEWNPNKINPWCFEELRILCDVPDINWYFMSCDIAVDIYEEYSSLIMLKRDKREYMASLGHSEIETRYLGSLGHGHIKFYNKAKERNISKEWTRFEITLKSVKASKGFDFNNITMIRNIPLDMFIEYCKIPKVYRKYVQIKSLDINDIWSLALEKCIDDINSLYSIKRYEQRKKMESLLGQTLQEVEIDISKMHSAFIKFFNSLKYYTEKDDKMLVQRFVEWNSLGKIKKSNCLKIEKDNKCSVCSKVAYKKFNDIWYCKEHYDEIVYRVE
ncbi:hypothetical protein [Clostridium perfringens]|uniref:hypothetical protein n=3 Tax=Clostridium perfringens TaxID=1502 RepID=UPI0039EC9DB6